MTTRTRTILAMICLLLLAAAWKLIFLLRDAFPFNSDEAIVALMARHILQGERPVFFYGQAYMGSLDAFLVAGGFALFGQQVWVIRLVQTLLYLGTLFTTILLGRAALGSWRVGLGAGLLLAVPAVNTTVYTTVSLGGYGEALLLGNLMLLAALALHRRDEAGSPMPAGWFWLWGLLAGMGVWANGLTLVYSAPSGLFLLWLVFRRRRPRPGLYLAWVALGVLAGASPWLGYIFNHGPRAVLAELFGNAVAVERAPWLAQLGQHALSYVLFGLTALFGFRPPWDVTWLALPLLPLALAFWLAVLGWTARAAVRERKHRAPRWLLLGMLLALTAGFLFTPFGVDPSGRYFVPMAIPLAVFAAELALRIMPRTRNAAALLGLLVAFHAWGTFQAARANPPGLTTQFYAPSVVDHRYDNELMRFLAAQGETRGYTNYWVAYPLTFRSEERLLFVPALPYHTDLRYTARDDRYAPYTRTVEISPRVAYIVTHNPPLASALRAGFERLLVTWQEQRIGDFEIFYHLSRPVRPDELDIRPPG